MLDTKKKKNGQCNGEKKERCKIEGDEAVLMTLVLQEKYCLHQLISLCPVHFLPNGVILFFFFFFPLVTSHQPTSTPVSDFFFFMFSCNDSWQKPREQGSLHCECVGGQGRSDNNSKCSKFVESRRSERVEAKTALLSWARLLELLKKLLKRRGTCILLLLRLLSAEKPASELLLRWISSRLSVAVKWPRKYSLIMRGWHRTWHLEVML